MRTRTLYLSDTASDGPYYAHATELHGPTRWRRVDYVEIMAVVAGQGRVVQWDEGGVPRQRKLEAGSMLFLRPGDDPLIEGLEPRGLSLLYVSFRDADWRAFVSLVGFEKRQIDAIPSYVPSGPDSSSQIGHFRRALESWTVSPRHVDLVRFLAAVTPALVALAPRTEQPNLPGWLRRCLAAMAEEGNLRAGFPRMVELAHVSPSHLASTTRRLLGATPTSVLTALRLRYAATLLATAEDEIAVVARRCGYERSSYFATSFRRIYGVSPREYRRRLAE
jgi:AraC-like DNA-binding protein